MVGRGEFMGARRCMADMTVPCDGQKPRHRNDEDEYKPTLQNVRRSP